VYCYSLGFIFASENPFVPLGIGTTMLGALLGELNWRHPKRVLLLSVVDDVSLMMGRYYSF
jgi:hypothetical protein